MWRSDRFLKSEIPATRPVSFNSLSLAITRSGPTRYGSSVTTMACRPRPMSSTWARALSRMVPRPVS